ncbi:iron permease FTR1 [Meredithblackwellia eburnea MCA 4105]
MGATSVFSIPLFFIVLRETIEASIVVSVLLSLVDNLVNKNSSTESTYQSIQDNDLATPPDETPEQRKQRLVRRMKLHIWAGTGVGLLISLAIGAVFIAIFFTTLSDLWGKSEEIWEGCFSLIAAILIFVMGITLLRIDRSKIKWTIKLERAFDKKSRGSLDGTEKSSKWSLFVLPLVTVLREGLEAVVFVGGVSLGQPASSIPLAAITGLLCGLLIGYLLFISSSRVSMSIFIVVSTNILFVLGAGLLTRSVNAFERHQWIVATHGAGGENGSGPGSFDVRKSVWHLDYGNPEDKLNAKGWGVAKALVGWSNNCSYGDLISYIGFWLAVAFTLIYMKWQEGRCTIFGKHSQARLRRLALKKQAQAAVLANSAVDEPQSGEPRRDASTSRISN